MNDITVKCRDALLETLIVNELVRLSYSVGRSGDCRLLITDRENIEIEREFTLGVSRIIERAEGHFDAVLRRPILMSELRETVLRLLDRTQVQGSVSHSELELLPNGIVRFCGREVSLTDNEYRLLGYLADRRGETVDREILKSTLGLEGNAVDVYICHLRRKLTFDDRNPIATVRGRGYILK